MSVAAGAATALSVVGLTGSPASAMWLEQPTTSAADSPAATTTVTTALPSYIVQLTPALDAAPALVRDLVAPLGGTVTYTYEHVLNGFAVRMPAAAATALSRLPGVASVHPDVTVRATGVENDATWGLDRIDQHALPVDRTYAYPDDAGRSANIYVIDTGIDSQHTEFTGRIGTSRNFVAGGLFGLGGVNPDSWTDCNGHGTHVSSTAAGTTWGVAKLATLHAVRVLNCSGSGSSSTIIAGIDWVAANHGPNAVANLSLGSSSRSADIDTAVANLVSSGVAVAVAAGNSNANACNSSPAAVPSVLTVGAIGADDARASFSNYGTCLDLFAPGVGITGAKYRTTNGSVQMDGTSMASPHVAGVLALLRSERPGLTAAQAEQAVVDGATNGVVTSAGTGSPTRLLWSGVAPASASPSSSTSPSTTPSSTPSTSPSTSPSASPTTAPTATPTPCRTLVCFFFG